MYDVNSFSLMAGYLDRWQGTDAGLNIIEPWQNTGDDGVYFGGISYSSDLIDASAWYYDISEDKLGTSATGNVANQSIYTDISFHANISQDFALHASAQYLNQNEQDNSGVDSSIYGVMAELVIMEDIAFSAAYNKSDKQSGKNSFSGFGGGTLYTNMDNMIIDNITADREARAIVAGITYSFGDFGFLYAYGDFDGDADSTGQKEHIVEQNIAIEYNPTENLTFGVICVINDDKENTSSAAYFNNGDFENYRLVAAYSF